MTGDLITEDELERARSDPEFRQHLLAQSLERLIDALNRARRHGDRTPEGARQIREGADLAVELAGRLQSSDPA